MLMKVKYLPTVKRIRDALWNEAKLLILPSEKPNNFIGRPAAVVSFRKIFDGIVYVFGMSYELASMSMEDNRCCPRSVWRRSDVLLKISAMVSIRYLRGYVMGLLKSV